MAVLLSQNCNNRSVYGFAAYSSISAGSKGRTAKSNTSNNHNVVVVVERMVVSPRRVGRQQHNNSKQGRSAFSAAATATTVCFGSARNDHDRVRTTPAAILLAEEKATTITTATINKDCSLKDEAGANNITTSGPPTTNAVVPLSSARFQPTKNVLPNQDDDDDYKAESSSSVLLQGQDDGVLTMMGLLFVVGSLSSLDRVAMSVALVPMSQEMPTSILTDTVKGSISSFFSVGYGLGIVPAGLLLSQPQASPRTIMAVGIALWSVGTIATPLLVVAANDTSMTLLLAARALVGMSESVVIPTIQKLLSAWIPIDKKSLAVATIFGGFQTGTILSYAISPAIMDAFDGNWRSIFYVYGGAGLLFLVPWWLLSQDVPPAPARSDAAQTVTAQEPIEGTVDDQLAQGTIENDSPATILQDVPWMQFLQSKATWAMFLAHAANNWGLYNNLSWTPTFYAEQYGLNVKESAWLLILPSLMGFVGGLTSGSIADRILQNQLDAASSDKDSIEANTTRIRRIFQALALLGPAICLATLSMSLVNGDDTPTMSQSLFAIAVGLQSFNAAGYGAANQEKAGPKYTGLLYAVTSLPSVIIGTVGVQWTGQILDSTQQNWSIVFGWNAAVYVLGATAFVTLYNSKREFE